MNLAKFLTTISLVVTGFQFASAAENIEFACVTEWPTTSFVAQTADNKVSLQLINHNGVGYMPIHSGLVTPNDIKTLAARAEVLKNVGDRAQTSFDLENCKIYVDNSFTCTQGTSFKGVDGKDIEVFSLSSSFNELRFNDLVFNQATLMLGLIIDKESYFIEMQYYTNECLFKNK